MSQPLTMRGVLAYAAFLAVRDGVRRDAYLGLARTFYDVLSEVDDRERMLDAIDPSVLVEMRREDQT